MVEECRVTAALLAASRGVPTPQNRVFRLRPQYEEFGRGSQWKAAQRAFACLSAKDFV